MMQFIHGNDWDVNMLESHIKERIRPQLVKKFPKIQIGGIAGNSNTEHLVVLKCG